MMPSSFTDDTAKVVRKSSLFILMKSYSKEAEAADYTFMMFSNVLWEKYSQGEKQPLET